MRTLSSSLETALEVQMNLTTPGFMDWYTGTDLSLDDKRLILP